MTEDEAKTKWCPFSRVLTFSSDAAGNMGANRDQKTFVPLGQCIASVCMAWRLTPTSPGGNITDGSGHCGLAGPP